MTKRSSIIVACLLGLGLAVFVLRSTSLASAQTAVGNCYSDAADYSTPTLCE